jgi:hypothetical protein
LRVDASTATPLSSNRFEVTVAATQDQIDVLARRIEHAYRLRRPGWHGQCSTSRVWAAAAGALLRAHEADGDCPPDPELFVAAQPLDPCFADPWRDLAHEAAAEHYGQRVRAIIRSLRAELRDEIRLAERRVANGRPLTQVLTGASHRLSPLGRYIIARRAGRPALADRFRDAAVLQHESCPLYQQASSPLLPADSYPTAVPHESHAWHAAVGPRPHHQIHLN